MPLSLERRGAIRSETAKGAPKVTGSHDQLQRTKDVPGYGRSTKRTEPG